MTTPDPLTCYQCGLLYGGPGWCDVVVNDDVWVVISPTGDEGGILCFNCIAARLDDLGMTDVRMLVKSGPFAHDSREKRNLTAPTPAFPTRSQFRIGVNGSVHCDLCPAYGGSGWGDNHALEEHLPCPECGRFFTFFGLSIHRARKHNVRRRR